MNLYKEKICSNCANKNCTNRIREIQIDKVTIIKCDDFICKNSRNMLVRRNQY